MLNQNDDPQDFQAQSQERELLLSEQNGAILILTMNRPEARNSLSEGLLTALLSAFDATAEDQTIRAIVLTGNGPAFSAGHDMKELTAHRSNSDEGHAYYEKIFALSSRLMRTIIRSPKPVIAAVQSTATAAGCQLVASCDLAVASTLAKFCTPGVNIGLFCSTPAVALSRNVSRKRAMEMLLLGDMISAAEAQTYGLVNRVVEPERVMDETLKMAERIASKAPETVALGKQAFYQQLELSLEKAYDHTAEVMVRNMLGENAKEGISAFLQKRAPKW